MPSARLNRFLGFCGVTFVAPCDESKDSWLKQFGATGRAAGVVWAARPFAGWKTEEQGERNKDSHSNERVRSAEEIPIHSHTTPGFNTLSLAASPQPWVWKQN